VIQMLVIGEATHYLDAMTAMVVKMSPNPHHGDEKRHAGAPWRVWCNFSRHTIQLGLHHSRCTHACNCQVGMKRSSKKS